MLRFFRLPPARRDAAEASSILREFWRRDRRREAVFADPESERRAGQEALKMLEQLERCSRIGGQPFVVGHAVRVGLVPGADLEGMIDTAELQPRGGVRVAQYLPRAVPRPEETSMEALVLSLGIVGRYRLSVNEVSFCLLQQGTTMTVKVDAGWTAKWRREAVLLVTGMLVDREFGPRPGPGCADCEFQGDCPAA